MALGCLLTPMLLTVSFTGWPLEWPYLAYVALVPWGLALSGAVNGRWAVTWAWAAGVAFWAINLYWLWWITLLGYAALVIWLSVYWLAAAVFLRAASRRLWPMWICLPVIWVALEYVRSWVLGFPWFFLAHSQYSHTRLIQLADVTGQYGISLFVAMVNGVVIDLVDLPLFMRQPQGRGRMIRGGACGAVAAVAAAGGMLGYGTYRLNQTDVLKEGPVVGIVQQAFPISLYEEGALPQKILHEHVSAGKRLVGRGCDLVIWPESMLPGPANPEFVELDPEKTSTDDLRAAVGCLIRAEGIEQLGRPWLMYEWRSIWEGKLLPEAWAARDVKEVPQELLRAVVARHAGTKDVSKCTRKELEDHWENLRKGVLVDGRRYLGLRDRVGQVAELARELDCPILVGAGTLHHNPDATKDRDRWLRRNSVLWFERNGRVTAQYAKRHLVLFSEYVPFKDTWPWFHDVLRGVVPDVMPQLDPGRSWKRFNLVRAEGKWALASPICFEGTFARICRKLVMSEGRKVVDILANLSNDGWFVWQYRGRPRRSAEHPQHLVQYCFRAIELRVPVVRSVNTGISASIDSNGRIVAQVNRHGQTMIPGTLLLKEPGERKSDARGCQLAPRILVDARTSLYSIAGDVFATIVGGLAAAMAVWLVWKRGDGRERAQG